nr:unnamed protein product [Digitaria exilis]
MSASVAVMPSSSPWGNAEPAGCPVAGAAGGESPAPTSKTASFDPSIPQQGSAWAWLVVASADASDESTSPPVPEELPPMSSSSDNRDDVVAAKPKRR